MKITLAQLNPIVGDIQGNVVLCKTAIQRACNDQADLIVFPELIISGYPPRDLLDRPAFIRQCEAAIQDIQQASLATPDLGIIVGTPWPNRAHAGAPLYNAAILIANGEILCIQPKMLLPAYDVFDETRYFEPAHQVQVAAFKGRRLAITVCEDAWFAAVSPDSRHRYHQNPMELLMADDPDLIINLSASPFFVGKTELRQSVFQNLARTHQLPVIMVNQVGSNDELIFDGGSLVISQEGEIARKLPYFCDQVHTIDLDYMHPTLSTTPEDIHLIHEALILGLRDYLKKTGFKQAVIGLSGGIDSAVVAALAAEALGPENITGITMPSPYSSSGSVNDSYALAKNLGIRIETIGITPIFDAYKTSLSPLFQGRAEDVTEENIQARIRGGLLMAFSNKFGNIVLTTGNKSELAVGYCTLYGDMCGGLAVISDVFKTVVYDLARYINRDREIIPDAIITKAPSAELRPDQKDEDSLPPYAVLDAILKQYLEDGHCADDIIAQGFEADTVHRVLRLIKISEYKRQQAAPGLKITPKAFGMGRRMVIAARYQD